MNTRLRSLLAFLALSPLVLAGGRPDDRPSFQPKSGTTQTKHVVIEGELELEDMRLELNGTDMSEQAGQAEVAMKTSMKVSVTDRYVTLEGGRPTRLERTFDTISLSQHASSSHPMAGDQERDIPASSELEGSTVVFSWNEGDSAYDVAFEDEQGDAELLEDLQEDMDLRGFLPPGEVAEGDTWKIPAEAVEHALAPGGDVKLRPDEGGDPMSGMDQFSPGDLVGDLEGEFEATYGGTREEDGARVAVIRVKIEGKSASDLSDKLEEMGEMAKDKVPVPIEFSAMDAEFEYEAEGELLWDLETGLAHSLHLSGEVRMIVDVSMSMSMGDSEQAMEISQTYAGTQTLTLTTGE